MRWRLEQLSTQITIRGKKRQGCSLRETESWRHKEPFKRPTHKFSFAATYSGLWQRRGQSGLETPKERLGKEAVGRELRVDASIPVLCHRPYSSSYPAQAATPLDSASVDLPFLHHLCESYHLVPPSLASFSHRRGFQVHPCRSTQYGCVFLFISE